MLRHLTTQRTLIIVLFVLLFGMAARVEQDSDTWWHIASGEFLLDTGAPIKDDPFSHTFVGEYRVHYEWLAQGVIAQAWRIGDGAALTLFTATLATAGLVALYFACVGSPYLRAFLLVAAAAGSAVFWSARPQMFSYAFVAVTLALVYPVVRGANPRRLLWLIPLMLVWAQMHVGWSFGFIILACAVMGEGFRWVLRENERPDAYRRGLWLSGVSIAAGAVLVINPYGLDLLRVPFETVSIGALTQFIDEWLPPNLLQTEVLPFTALLIASALTLALNLRRVRPFEIILLLVTGMLALRAARNISFFALAAVPILSVYLDAFLTRRGWVLKAATQAKPVAAVLNLVLIVLVLLVAVLKVSLSLDPRTIAEVRAARFPVEAVRVMQAESAPPTVFNSYNWGGYIIANAPDFPVFIDGRTDLYREFVLTYLDAASAQGDWRALLDQYGVNTVLLESRAPLVEALQSEAGWRIAYQDALATLLIRDGS